MASLGTEILEQPDPLSPTVDETESLNQSDHKDVVRLRDVPMATGFCIVSKVAEDTEGQLIILQS